MTALRQSAIMELEKIPEDKLSFVIQIMQGVNGLYNDSNKERKEAFARLAGNAGIDQFTSCKHPHVGVNHHGIHAANPAVKVHHFCNLFIIASDCCFIKIHAVGLFIVIASAPKTA